jgi:SARP family transcriptional regulator, regulator of embCAB operon
MEFRVLGPLSVRQDGNALIRTTRKLRQLLALLLLNEPHRVSVTSLITELWDDAAPDCAITTLQTHVFYLRAEFARKLDVARGTIARDLLQTHGGGYRIILGDNVFDLREFHRLRTLAQARLTTGDAPGAGRLLSEALDQWCGPALLDVDHGRLLRARVNELDRWRLDALALFFGTQLDAGGHREVLSELARLVVRHTCQEELHAQFMIALYRSGYRTRALEVFEDLRRSLHDQLGTTPSSRLTALCHGIRVADTAAVDAARSSGVGTAV